MDEFSASARMNQYEKGVHAPDFKTVKALAKVLEVPTAFLFCEEDELAAQIVTYRNNKVIISLSNHPYLNSGTTPQKTPPKPK